jgi:UDP:flavonoid glycosyltransferase YjiC (YdhE family)
MRIALIGYGTRGDVQPSLILADALRAGGYDVRLVAPRNMASWIERAAIPFAPLPLDTQQLFSTEEGQRMLGGSAPDNRMS